VRLGAAGPGAASKSGGRSGNRAPVSIRSVSPGTRRSWLAFPALPVTGLRSFLTGFRSRHLPLVGGFRPARVGVRSCFSCASDGRFPATFGRFSAASDERVSLTFEQFLLNQLLVIADCLLRHAGRFRRRALATIFQGKIRSPRSLTSFPHRRGFPRKPAKTSVKFAAGAQVALFRPRTPGRPNRPPRAVSGDRPIRSHPIAAARHMVVSP
jgi:hypothetical protein